MPQAFKYKTETLCIALSLLFALLTLPSSLYSWHHLPRWVPKVFAQAIERMAQNQRPLVHRPYVPPTAPSSFQTAFSKFFKGLRPNKQPSQEKTAPNPAAQASSFLSNLKLSGIIAGSGEGSQAVINDEIYSEGQTVSGFTITRIHSGQVLLTKDQDTYSLSTEGLKKISEAPKNPPSNETASV